MRKDFGEAVPTFGKQPIGHAIEGGRVNGMGGIGFRLVRHRDVPFWNARIGVAVREENRYGGRVSCLLDFDPPLPRHRAVGVFDF